MPELAEVEIARRHLTRFTMGAVVRAASLEDPRVWTAGDVEHLVGATFDGWDRVGKQLVGRLGSLRLLVHLGMTGRWQRADGARHVCLRLTVSSAERTTELAYCDQRRFGELALVDADAATARLASLGTDAWDCPPSADWLEERARRSSRPLKHALMDQQLLAGLGNIAAVEVAHRARVHPLAPVRTLDRPAWDRVLVAIHEHLGMLLALDDGEPITYVSEGGQNPFLVYGRRGTPCPACGVALVGQQVSGRPTVWCPDCQPPPGGTRQGASTVCVPRPS